jgi:Na+/H+ antiporter NhaD/arsenite permease-like protein
MPVARTSRRAPPTASRPRAVVAFVTALAALAAPVALAATHADPPTVAGIPVDFILFATTLAGVALFHHHTLRVALTGLAVITAYKLAFTGFKTGPGFGGLGTHILHEWVVLANLFLLLTGFALLSRHFEKSRVPLVLPRVLPGDWYGPFVLLLMVFVLSSFLDNIAAALIGGAMAHQLFRANVHIGYLAAIVAASNAGGSGSVVGDTTTTMMWIDGVSPFDVVHAYVAAVVAVVILGVPAARMQHRLQPMIRHAHERAHVDWIRVGIVLLILLSAIIANITINLRFAEYADYFPFIGFAVWVALAMSLPARRPDWEVLPDATRGAIFLLSLVGCASMMPVEQLPAASWPTALGLGFVSAVFDNIPLTALALKQGGYDWGFLAYAVGFGGSMLWFGSSAGVALANMYPEARSVRLWVRHGYWVAIAYVVGFFVMLFTLGWQPHPKHKLPRPAVTAAAPAAPAVSAAPAASAPSTAIAAPPS